MDDDRAPDKSQPGRRQPGSGRDARPARREAPPRAGSGRDAKPAAGAGREAPPPAAGAGRRAPEVRAPLFQPPQFLPPDFQAVQPPSGRADEAPKSEGQRRPDDRAGGREPSRPAQSNAAEVADDPTPPRKGAAKKAEPAKAATKKAEPAKATAKKAQPAKAPAKKATKAATEEPAKKTAAKKAAPAKKATTAKSTRAPAKKAAAEQASTPSKKATVKKVVREVAEDQQPATKAAKAIATARPEMIENTKLTKQGERIWTKIWTTPEYAPELLALAAVNHLGPQARDWAADIRGTYPAATPEGLARLAIQQFTRASAAAGVAAIATGRSGAAIELGGVAWAEARLVLHLAAAYGQDPTDPERAVDLLVLTQVHPTAEAAREALAAANKEEPRSAQRLVPTLSGRTRGWGLRRLAARLLPGAGLLLAISGTTASAQRLAARATEHYKDRVRAS
jgi:chemotaxis protein histidine kinase CheA